jgi:hypothetical protein
MPKPGVLTCLILVAAAGVARADRREAISELSRHLEMATASAPAGSPREQESQFKEGLLLGVAGMLSLAESFSPEMADAVERTLRLGAPATGTPNLGVSPEGAVTLWSIEDKARDGADGTRFLLFGIDDRTLRLQAMRSIYKPGGFVRTMRRSVVFRGANRASAAVGILSTDNMRNDTPLTVRGRHLSQRRDGQSIRSRARSNQIVLDVGGPVHSVLSRSRTPMVRSTTSVPASVPRTHGIDPVSLLFPRLRRAPNASGRPRP